MSRNSKRIALWLLQFAALGLLYSTTALAKKPPEPPEPPAEDEPISYTLVELSSSPGSASAINQLDGAVAIAGVLYDHSGEVSVHRAHSWMVNPSGDVLSTPLTTLPPDVVGAVVGSSATDVNSQGVIVGSQWDHLGSRRPLFWASATSEPLELPTPAGTVGWARATSINDAGVVVGEAQTASGAHLVAWKTDVIDGAAMIGAPQTILTAPATWDGSAVFGAYQFPQIANSGYVCVTLNVSSTEPDFTDQRAIRLQLDWDGQQVWAVPGSRTQLFDRWSIANGVNTAGTVCGRCAPTEPGWGIAYVMTYTGELLDLPALPAVKIKRSVYTEASRENAYALNNATPVQIVGQGARAISLGTLQDSEKVPLRWDGEDAVTDVRTVTDSPSEDLWLHDINDAGWIIATSIDVPVLLIPNQ